MEWAWPQVVVWIAFASVTTWAVWRDDADEPGERAGRTIGCFVIGTLVVVILHAGGFW